MTLTREILAMAKAAGADCIVTACPLCQINLDLRQKDIEAKFGETLRPAGLLLHAVAGPGLRPVAEGAGPAQPGGGPDAAAGSKLRSCFAAALARRR